MIYNIPEMSVDQAAEFLRRFAGLECGQRAKVTFTVTKSDYVVVSIALPDDPHADAFVESVKRGELSRLNIAELEEMAVGTDHVSQVPLV